MLAESSIRIDRAGAYCTVSWALSGGRGVLLSSCGTGEAWTFREVGICH